MQSTKHIPKIAFTYWSGKELSYLHLLTIGSFTQLNPDWDVIVYHPKNDIATNAKSYNSHEHSVKIRKRFPIDDLYKNNTRVKSISIDFEADYGISSKLYHTYFADFIRIKKLEEHGGMWFDMDIIFTRPLPEALTVLQSGKSFIATSYANTIPTGLLAAEPNSEIVKNVSEEASAIMSSGAHSNFSETKNLKADYQAIGPDLWRKHHAGFLDSNLKNAPHTQAFDSKLIYPYLWNEIDKYFLSTRHNEQLSDEVIGVHWFNGSLPARGFINNGLGYCSILKPKTPFETTLAHLRNEGLKINPLLAKAPLPKNKSEIKVSIAMGYFNRMDQLIPTLSGIAQSRHKNVEVIIVDDGSDRNQQLQTFLPRINKRLGLDIVMIEVKPEEKTWLNPCIAYNTAIRRATGEIVIIQNPEVMHVGDCIQYVVNELKPKDWFSFNCYGSGGFKENAEMTAGGPSSIVKLIQKRGFRIGGNSVQRDDVGGWLNHYEKHFVAYHYCAAAYKEDLFEQLDGGFNNEFANLLGGDDDELIKRMIHKGFTFKINKLGRNTPFTVHQYHEKSTHVASSTPELIAETRAVLDRCITDLGYAPENNIHKAPVAETPMGHRKLI